MSKHGKYVVYMAVNQITGSRYIGATTVGLYRRKRGHIYDALRGCDSCTKFFRAIRKYGPDSFEWLTIYTTTTRKKLFEAEIRLIAQLKPEYNITSGGQGLLGLKRTKRWRRKISTALKGRKPSQACIEAFRKVGAPKLYKSVVCLNDGRFFQSVKDAKAYYEGCAVGEVICGRITFSKGLTFVRANKPLPERKRRVLLEERQVRSAKIKASPKHCRAVTCINTGEEFPTVKAAAARHNLCAVTVISSCKRGHHTPEGLSFRYSASEAPLRKFCQTEIGKVEGRQKRLAALRRGQLKIKKPVKIIETGEVFESITSLAKHLGVKSGGVYDCVVIGRKHRATGLTFKPLEQEDLH